MSILSTLRALEHQGDLTRYVPVSRYRPRRRLYLSKAAMTDFTDPKSATNILTGRGYIEASLSRWTLGSRVYGSRRRHGFLVRLEPPPPETWEVRVTEPSVQARLLGRFAEPDTLVLFKFYTRQLLGSKGSESWRQAMVECEAQWRALFQQETPHSKKFMRDYVTENCDDYEL